MKRSVGRRRLYHGGILVLALSIMVGVVTLSGCSRTKFAVDYGGQQSCYRGAKDAYRAGQTVKLYYDEVGTDTDYSFLLDGEDLNCTFRRNKGFLIRFVMPAHDVALRCVAQCSMIRDEAPTDAPDGTAVAAAETETDTTITEPQTKPPATVPQTATGTTAPATTAMPNGAYDFTAQYIRTNGVPEDAKFPQGFCIDDRAALDAYLAGYRQSYRTSGAALEDAAQRYDDAWFASHTLLVAVLEESSGSVRHTVTRVEKTAPHAGTVEIKRDVPEVGTCDMAYWHILIELPVGVFGAADAIEVVMQ